jgi:hypothetical protein
VGTVANRIYYFFRGWYWRSRFLEDMSNRMKRQVVVEIALLDYAHGKRELYPDEAEDLALYLGDPTYVRRTT